MKVLYAIQGTGNGHLSRALEIFPILNDYCSCDILISGTQCDLNPEFPVKYRLKGFSFIFGKTGGIDYRQTFKRFRLATFIREIFSIRLSEYDLVINDFEPITAWACKLRGVPVIGLSHQGAMLSRHVPRPKRKDFLGRLILSWYAPVKEHIAFHFKEYSPQIYTPVIRKEVRCLDSQDLGYYTVYLPSYDDDRVIRILSRFSHIQWHLFSKHSHENYVKGNVTVNTISSGSFVKDMASAHGVLCGAGFETPAEALFLRKKLMVIPMKGQYEQQCNAAALYEMGVPVIPELSDKFAGQIEEWTRNESRVQVNYQDQTRRIIRNLLAIDLQRVLSRNNWLAGYRLTLKPMHFRTVKS